MNPLLNAVKFVGGSILIIGIILFTFGFFSQGPSILTPIGIGTVVSGIFIFLMGMFLVISEEVLLKTQISKVK